MIYRDATHKTPRRLSAIFLMAGWQTISEHFCGCTEKVANDLQAVYISF
jgi:hypothetical protein